MKVMVGSDCYGYPMKLVVSRWLTGQGYEVHDVGGGREPDGQIIDYADAVAGAVSRGEADRGILLCMSGGMMAIRANRWRQVRASMAMQEDIIRHDREASDVNVLCVAAHYETAAEMEAKLAVFMQTPFEPLERRMKRLAALESDLW